MRKIKIESWKGKTPDGKEVEENLLIALNALLNSKKPEEIPRGLDKFRLFSRLAKAFDKAEKTKVLELEEIDYNFLKDMIDKDVPSVWAFNPQISKAIDNFIDAKSEE